MTFIKTIPIPFSSAGGAPNPNDVFAIPESDEKNAFFVSNDHRFKEGILRRIEDVGRLPLGHLSYYDDEEGWKIVAKNIITANGLTGTKNMASISSPSSTTNKKQKVKEEVEDVDVEGEIEDDEDDNKESSNTNTPLPSNTLYVSSCLGGIIRVFSRTYGSSQILPIQDIIVDSMIDNPSLSYPSQSRFLIAGYPEPVVLHDYVFKPIDETGRPRSSPAVVYSFNTNQIGSSFYGSGFTGEVPVETIFADRKGLLGNATSVAVLVEAKVSGEKGDLYMSGLMTEGVMKCRKFA